MKFFELKNLTKEKDTVVARWAKMLIVLLLVTLLFLIPTFITVIHTYFYNSIEIKLSSMYSDNVSNFFNSYNLSSKEAFYEASDKYINSVNQHNKDNGIEVQILDKNGYVVSTTTGFEHDEKIQEYQKALESDLRKAKFVGKNENREKIMAITFLLPKYAGTETGAIRYITSLK